MPEQLGRQRLWTMAAKAPYRGAPTVFAGDGWAVGVQRDGDDADVTQGNDHVLALHGYIANQRELDSYSGAGVGPGSALAHRLLVAFLRAGEEIFARLRGEFAVLIYDSRRHFLLLARDVFGLRPLHLGAGKDGMAVASDARQVLAGLAKPVQLNAVRLAGWIARAYVLSDETYFSGVSQVLPGRVHRWVMAPTPRYVRGKEFWQPPQPAAGKPVVVGEAAGELRRHLEVAVARTLPDRPFGVTVSGGLDSSLVWLLVRSLARQGNVVAAKGRAFSLVFPGCSWDESEYIQAVQEAGGGDGGVLVDGSGVRFAEGMWGLAGRADSPLLPSLLLSELLMEVARRGGHSVLLYGSGGNEWLQGSLVYLQEELRAGRVGTVVRDLLRLELPRRGARWRLTRRTVLGALSLRRSQAHAKSRLVPGLAADVAEAIVAQMASCPGFWGWQRAFVTNRQRMEQNILYHQSGALSGREQVSAFWGSESRSPLFDLDLVNFCLSLPGRAFIAGVRPRHLQRLAGAGLLPAKVENRRVNSYLTPLYAREMKGVLDRLPRRSADWQLAGLGIVTVEGLDRLLDERYPIGRLPDTATEVIVAEVFAGVQLGVYRL